MILKKNYEGSSVDVTLANTFKHDTLRKTVNIFTGFARDGWNITGGVTLRAEGSLELLVGDRALLYQDFAEPAPCRAHGWWVHLLLIGRIFTRIE